MRKSVFQTKYEEQCVLNEELSKLLTAKTEEIGRLKKDNDTYARVIERKNGELNESKDWYQRASAKVTDLQDTVRELEAKIQTLLATVHLLARAADKDPTCPIDPTF